MYFLENFVMLILIFYFFLFKTHCHQLYGAAMWYNNFSCSLIIKQFANGYHSAIKRILKVQKWESNHLVCEATDWSYHI